jgi:hypothetical protein
MIKALVELSKVEIHEAIVVYDYMILEYTDMTLTAERVRRSLVDVSAETGVAGQQLMGDQRSEPKVIGTKLHCDEFLEFLGNFNKDGKLADVRDIEEENKND